jgi:nucleotidyltransferase/DNA polymerase involved in DNA repair
MTQDPFTPVDELRNFGAVTAQRLTDMEIRTLGDIQELGAVETYARLRFAFGTGVTRNALHAIEATLRDIDWRDLPSDVKSDLDAAVAARLALVPTRLSA